MSGTSVNVGTRYWNSPPVRFALLDCHLLEQRHTDALHGPAGDLPLDRPGVDGAPDVVGGDVAQERDVAGVEVDLEVAQVRPESEVGKHSIGLEALLHRRALWPVERPEDLDGDVAAPADGEGLGHRHRLAGAAMPPSVMRRDPAGAPVSAATAARMPARNETLAS